MNFIHPYLKSYVFVKHSVDFYPPTENCNSLVFTVHMMYEMKPMMYQKCHVLHFGTYFL